MYGTCLTFASYAEILQNVVMCYWR